MERVLHFQLKFVHWVCCLGQSFSPGSVITEESSLLSGDYIDLGVPTFKTMPGKSSSEEDWELPPTEEFRWIFFDAFLW